MNCNIFLVLIFLIAACPAYAIQDPQTIQDPEPYENEDTELNEDPREPVRAPRNLSTAIAWHRSMLDQLWQEYRQLGAQKTALYRQKNNGEIDERTMRERIREIERLEAINLQRRSDLERSLGPLVDLAFNLDPVPVNSILQYDPADRRNWPPELSIRFDEYQTGLQRWKHLLRVRETNASIDPTAVDRLDKMLELYRVELIARGVDVPPRDRSRDNSRTETTAPKNLEEEEKRLGG
ncbi:MAG: hypothetical protein ACR2NP_12925 [Pirellulaceae bacterium]